MQHRAEHQDEARALQLRRVAVLGLDQVHQRVRQRAVVADGAGEDELHVALDERVHDPVLQDALAHRARDRSGVVDPIDRTHVVLVALLDGLPRLQAHAERRPEEAVLDVVDRERVAGQQRVHPAAADERAERVDAAGVDHDRPGDDDDALAAFAGGAHHVRDPADARLDLALRTDVVAHEGERLPPALGPLHVQAHSVDAAHDVIPGAHVAQLHAARRAVLDDDDGVHTLPADFDPAPAEPHLGPVVRRRVEVLRHAGVLGELGEPRVLPRLHRAPERERRLDRRAQRLLVGRRDPDLDLGLVVVRRADLEAQDLVRGAVLEDLVEDVLQEAAIDEVALGADGLVGHRANGRVPDGG